MITWLHDVNDYKQKQHEYYTSIVDSHSIAHIDSMVLNCEKNNL